MTIKCFYKHGPIPGGSYTEHGPETGSRYGKTWVAGNRPALPPPLLLAFARQCPASGGRGPVRGAGCCHTGGEQCEPAALQAGWVEAL